MPSARARSPTNRPEIFSWPCSLAAAPPVSKAGKSEPEFVPRLGALKFIGRAGLPCATGRRIITIGVDAAVGDAGVLLVGDVVEAAENLQTGHGARCPAQQQIECGVGVKLRADVA